MKKLIILSVFVSLCQLVSAQPANDNICNASALSVGTNGPFDITGATPEVGEPPPAAGTNNCTSQDGWCSAAA
jgi:hypothetical protein